MNVVELNNAVEKIVRFLSIVKSYSNLDVYDYWGGGELKYGSVVFNVASASVSDSYVDYECVIYYGDRLTKDKSNRDDIYSDAVSVIRRVLNRLQEDYPTEVQVPSSIAFFEQEFADLIAGGYLNFTVRVAGDSCGFGEGDFNNDFDQSYD